MAEVIRDHHVLADRVRAHQARGECVVLANGCFDLLHVGHVRFLQGAKAAGDVLIVALNSDASVRKFKPDGMRPLMPEDERAEIIRAFEMVDYVTIFEEPTADAILDALRPDVQAKGTDYTPEAVTERGTVEAYGGRIVIVGDPKDHSTTDVIARIQGGAA